MGLACGHVLGLVLGKEAFGLNIGNIRSCVVGPGLVLGLVAGRVPVLGLVLDLCSWHLGAAPFNLCNGVDPW